MGFEVANVKFDYSVGDSVKITGGSFDGFIGTIQEINKDKNKVKVSISMFGRETPVEVDFSQVGKMN